MSGRGKKIIAWAVGLSALLLVVGGSYSAWNRADPRQTCAGCHEVAPSHATWTVSAHAELHCTECHGTALENFHSAGEKAGMVWKHFTDDIHSGEVAMNEAQLLEVMDRCIECHAAEHAGWLAGGHAVTYDEIFADSLHNAAEKPYWDCLRCHGMFFDGNIHDLMELTGDDPAGWHIKGPGQGGRYAVPCMACHEIHTENPPSERYVSMTDSISRAERRRNPPTALYVRTDKMHLRSDRLQRIGMLDGGSGEDGEGGGWGDPIEGLASDPSTLLCLQCHSPNYSHRAGSSDDRTVTGDHIGMSCVACHKPHSGETLQSCARCHPDLTEQQIRDVFDAPHSYQSSLKN